MKFPWMLFHVRSKNNLNYRNVCGFYPSPHGNFYEKKECESTSELSLVPLTALPLESHYLI